MKKRIEFTGYVNSRSLKRFIGGRVKSIIIHNDKTIVMVMDTESIHVTLSPTRADEGSIGQEPKPDYEAMVADLIYLREHCFVPSRPKLQRVIDFLILQTKHTPRPDTSRNEVREKEKEEPGETG